MRDFVPSFLLAIVVIATILVWELTPPNSGTVIAVLGPNASLKHTVNATDAYLIRESRLPNSYVLFSRADDFPARLREAGAVLVLNSDYSGACISSSRDQASIRMSALR